MKNSRTLSHFAYEDPLIRTILRIIGKAWWQLMDLKTIVGLQGCMTSKTDGARLLAKISSQLGSCRLNGVRVQIMQFRLKQARTHLLSNSSVCSSQWSTVGGQMKPTRNSRTHGMLQKYTNQLHLLSMLPRLAFWKTQQLKKTLFFSATLLCFSVKTLCSRTKTLCFSKQ